MNKKHVALRLIFVAVLAGSVPPGMARDTDIYLSPPRTTRNDAPNVMLVVDTSRFMAEQVQTSIYNASTSYCPGGTYTCYDPNKLYWVSGTGDIPPMDSVQWLQWYDATGTTRVLTNNCASTQNILSTKGWASAKFINWNAGGERWAQLSSSYHTPPYIECDETEPSNLYVAKNASNWSNAYTTNSRQEFDFNISTIALYSGNYLNFLLYRPATTTAPRLEVAKDVLKTIIDTNPGVRFGLMTFNRNWDATDTSCPSDANGVTIPCNNRPPNGGRVVMAIGNMSQPVTLPDGTQGTRAALMKIRIDQLSLTPDTFVQAAPVAETLYEAYRYFSGNSLVYGDDHEEFEFMSPNPARDLDAEAAAAPYNYITPFGYQCQQAYIVYITAGHPEFDDAADGAVQSLTGTACTDNCLDELAGYMYDNDLVTTGLTGTQRVVTSTVGFGNLSAAETTLLQNAAYKGHGRYVTVNDATDLVGALRDTLVSIQVTNASFAAPSLSVNAFNKLFNRDEVYFALFTPSTTVRWDGNIKKFTLCTIPEPSDPSAPPPPCKFGEVVYNTTTPAIDSVTQRIKQEAMSDWNTGLADGGTVTLGGAGSKLPDPVNRVLYTYTGSYPVTAGGVNLATGTATNPEAYLVKDTNADLTGTLLGLPDDAERANLINWMRGQDVYNQDQDSSTTKRWSFGDPLHSRPVAITYGCANSVNGTCAATAPPIIKLFVGTNDGGVRMINDKNGIEEWAFFPKEVLTTQRTLSQDADGIHPDGMDGTPSFWVIDNNRNGIIEPGNNDKVYMYIGMRRGGRYVYAFDVTPTSTLTDPNAISTTTSGIVPKLLWVIRGGVDADYARLGQTWSRPVIARIRWSKGGSTTDSEYQTVLIFGGGYDPNQDRAAWPGKDSYGNAVYMADPLTGARLWWASNAGSGANLELPYMDYSIPSDLALMDPDGDGAIDRIYVGDVAGQLWRIDLNPTLTSTDNRSKGFRLADIGCPNGTRGDATVVCSGTPNQARRKFFYPPDVVQMDDTTYEDVNQSQYDLVVIGSGDREDPLDNHTGNLAIPEAPVNNRVYAFRDYKIKNLVVTGETAPATPITEATATDDTAAEMANKVYDVTANNVQSTDGTIRNTAILLMKAGSGWYLDLKDPAATTTFAPWVGEKVLAKAVVFDNAIYVTTYTPASDDTAQITCAASEGLAKLYTLGLGAGTPLVDNNANGNITTDDRSKNLGGGIPSELITVIRESGTSALVGTSGGAATPKISSALPRFKTYWVEE